MSDEQQQTEQTTSEPTREELVAAAEAASAGVIDKPETAATAGEAPTPAAETPAADEPRWQRIVREREKGHAERQEAQSYAAEARRKADEESARIVAEAKERARAEAERELAEARAKFGADPIAHLRSLGTPEEIQDAVMRAGTPEARAFAKLQAELAETKQRASAADDVKKQFEDFKKAQETERIQSRNARAEEVFLTQHATPEKAPYLHARYERDEMIDRANKIAISWHDAGQKGFDLDDVVQYMEYEAKKRFDALSSRSQPQVNGAAPVSGIAPKVPANGPRTMTGATNGERRSAPKPLGEMTREQYRKALVEEAEEAMRAIEAKQ